MNVTKEGIKCRQLQIEDYLQMVSSEREEYAEVYAASRITEGNISNTGMSNDVAFYKQTLQDNSTGFLNCAL